MDGRALLLDLSGNQDHDRAEVIADILTSIREPRAGA
jgi:hypothetical protein